METALLETLKSASPLVLVLLLVNGVGMILKSIKRLDNDFIPVILIVLGGGACVGLFPTSDMPFACPYPWVYKLVIGGIIGAASVGVHQAVSRIAERNEPEKKLAALEAEKKELETEISAKPKPPPNV